jgi:hypothetical protein
MQMTFDKALRSQKGSSRHVARLSPRNVRPTYIFDFRSDWSFGRRVQPSFSGVHDFHAQAFDAQLEQLAKRAGRPLTAVEMDFVWLAFAVYAADRFASRHPFGPNGTSFWRRRLHVRVPMRERQLWANIEPKLVRALEMLTEDDWTFEFLGDRASFSVEMQGHFRRFEHSDIHWVSLFSGGLDSLAGALRWLIREPGRGLLVSGQTHSRMRTAQELVVKHLSDEFSDRVDHIGVQYGFPEKQETSGVESSQRARAFVHVCLGALAALTVGSSRLFLFENGVGAFNLPCDSAQIGSQNSRGTHSVFLSRMETYVSAVFGKRFAIENPFTFSTKGQMLGFPPLAKYEQLLQRSFSCDRFPNYHHRAPQCGFCPSCLIRRLAFHASRLPDSPEGYPVDVLDQNRAMRAGELTPLTKLSIQADVLATRLSNARPWQELCATWPDLFSAEREIGFPGFSKNVQMLLKRHVTEWRSFSAAMAANFLAAAA